GLAAATPACDATVAGGALCAGGRGTTGATASAPACGGALGDGATGGGALTPAQPDSMSTMAKPTAPTRFITRSSASFVRGSISRSDQMVVLAIGMRAIYSRMVMTTIPSSLV